MTEQEKGACGYYAGPERRESFKGRRGQVSDRRFKAGLAPGVLKERRKRRPGRRVTDDMPDRWRYQEAHPGYVKGAVEALKAEVDFITEHLGGVTDVLRGSIKAEPPGSGQLEADNWKHRSQAMRCKTCMFYVPKVRPPRAAIEGCALSGLPQPVLGRCRRRSPTLNGWPAMFESDYCGDHKLDEEKME